MSEASLRSGDVAIPANANACMYAYASSTSPSPLRRDS